MGKNRCGEMDNDGEKLATVCLAVLSLSDNFVINGKWRYSLRGVKVRRGS